MWEVLKIIAGFIFDLVVYLRLVHVSDEDTRHRPPWLPEIRRPVLVPGQLAWGTLQVPEGEVSGFEILVDLWTPDRHPVEPALHEHRCEPGDPRPRLHEEHQQADPSEQNQEHQQDHPNAFLLHSCTMGHRGGKSAGPIGQSQTAYNFALAGSRLTQHMLYLATRSICT